jgi:hypothetical protein
MFYTKMVRKETDFLLDVLGIESNKIVIMY